MASKVELLCKERHRITVVSYPGRCDTGEERILFDLWVMHGIAMKAIPPVCPRCGSRFQDWIYHVLTIHQATG